MAQARKAGATGGFVVSVHAFGRQAQRGVARADIQQALATATSATFQTDHETWRIDGGKDFDGDDLTVIVVFEGTVVVVTVF